MTTQIDWRDMPLLMTRSARQVKRAGAETLNAVGFKALPALVVQAHKAWLACRQSNRS
jgi:UDP-N-acetylglucosamine:LPS N-acetylglucosamine transferase